MSADTPEVAAARIEAARARGRLLDSAQALQVRLNPRKLASDTWEGAKMKGADAIEDAVDAVRARPVAATGVAAAVALFLAREPLIDLAGKLMRGKKEAKPAPKRSKDKKPARAGNTESRK